MLRRDKSMQTRFEQPLKLTLLRSRPRAKPNGRCATTSTELLLHTKRRW